MSNILDQYLRAYEDGGLYNFDNNILLNWYPQRVLQHAPSANSLLELGLGHGFTTDIFSRYFKRHLVLDGSPAVIESFRKKYPNCKTQIVETYFENFSTEERFDVIVMGFVLEHVHEPIRVIRSFCKYLMPGGRIFIAVPNAEALNRRLGHKAGLLTDMTELSSNDSLLGHRRYYSMLSLCKDIEQAGCKVDRMEGIYLKPFTTRQIISLQLDSTLIEALCAVGIDYPELSCGLFCEISPV